MYLSADLIFEELSRTCSVRKRGPADRAEHLHPPLLYQSGMRLLCDQTYVGMGNSFPPGTIVPKDCCIIALNDLPDFMTVNQFSLIVVDTPIELPQLLNQVQQIFDRYAQWDMQLNQLILRNAEVQVFLDKSQPLFPGNFLLVLDANYYVLATTSARDFVMDESGRTPASVFARFKKDPEYAKMRHCKDTFLYRGLFFDHDILTHHIFINGELCGTITLTEQESPITLGKWTLFEHLARIITLFYPQRLFLARKASQQLVKAFSRILNGDTVVEAELLSSIASFDWSKEDQYVTCFIPITETDKRIGAAFYLCEKLEELLPSALALEYNLDIVVLLNTTKTNVREELSKQALRAFLTGSILQTGVSKPFHNLLRLKTYYYQAQSALNLGTRMNPGNLVYHFVDYLLPYMTSVLANGIAPESLCPEGLWIMQKLDQQKGTEYIKTLSTYFRTGFNATQSSKNLYVNRSTFLDRMAKIKKILDLDLDDYETRLYLMLCLQLLDAWPQG